MVLGGTGDLVRGGTLGRLDPGPRDEDGTPIAETPLDLLASDASEALDDADAVDGGGLLFDASTIACSTVSITFRVIRWSSHVRALASSPKPDRAWIAAVRIGP